MPFTTPLKMQAIRGKNKYKLTECLIYRSSGKVKIFMIPADFITDFATIPKAFRWLIDDNDSVIRDAAVLHDFLYSKRSRVHQNVSRLQADKLLIEAMKSLGASWFKRALVFLVVRACGWAYFKKGGDE